MQTKNPAIWLGFLFFDCVPMRYRIGE